MANNSVMHDKEIVALAQMNEQLNDAYEVLSDQCRQERDDATVHITQLQNDCDASARALEELNHAHMYLEATHADVLDALAKSTDEVHACVVAHRHLEDVGVADAAVIAELSHRMSAYEDGEREVNTHSPSMI